MDWHSCPSITPPARSDAQGSVTLWSSPACSTLSFSRARSWSGRRCRIPSSVPKGSVIAGEFGDWQDSNCAAEIQCENGEGCFLYTSLCGSVAVGNG